ncbi:large neutral amino acids transporter small subunit 1-like [Argopecten irradians]|uniref:large neutral amino acids transporter small subunit 1-like n=1 Tax=Argopecten irradians TaxID=31199 RepID=UPI00372417E1
MSIVVSSLAAGTYILRPVFLYCPDLAPTASIKLLGLIFMASFLALNCYSVKITAYIQTAVTFTKVLALVLISIFGLITIAKGDTENLRDPFETTDLTASGLVFAFYVGTYAFNGGDTIAYAYEEYVNPKRVVIWGTVVGHIIPTIVYLLTNIAYYTVLTKVEILSGVAVAVGIVACLIMIGIEMISLLKVYSFLNALYCLVAIVGIFKLRKTHNPPDALRLPIVIPIAYTCLSLFMTVTTVVYNPGVVVASLLCISLGIVLKLLLCVGQAKDSAFRGFYYKIHGPIVKFCHSALLSEFTKE